MFIMRRNDDCPLAIKNRNGKASAFGEEHGLIGFEARVAYELVERGADLKDVVDNVPLDKLLKGQNIGRVLERVIADYDVVPLNDVFSNDSVVDGRIRTPKDLVAYMEVNDGYQAKMADENCRDSYEAVLGRNAL